MRLMHSALLAIAFAVLSTAGQAATSEGMVELDFGAGFRDSDTDTGSFSNLFLTVSGGYFLTDAFELLGVFSYERVEVDGNSADTQLIGAGIDYHFNTDQAMVPFVGVTLQTGSSGDVDSTYFDAHAGVKYFLNEHVAVRMALSMAQIDSEIGGAEFATDQLDLSAGFSIFFP